jgi:hypothetical protein
MIYLVAGNHVTLSGFWEQIEITLRTFKEMDLEISIVSRIQPGEINILIEDFNSVLVDEMIAVKAKHPDTSYVLYVTEYLTGHKKGSLTLNCFTLKARWMRKLFRIENALAGDAYNMPHGGSAAARWRLRIRRIAEKVLIPLCRLTQLSYGNELMMARREACLEQARELFSLCISTTEAVLNGYDDYCDCRLVYLPVFIDERRMKDNQGSSKKYPAIIFSGRLTAYRQKVAQLIGQDLRNGYPLDGGVAWNALLTDTTFKISRLAEERETFGEDAAKRFSESLLLTELPPFDILSTDIYSYIEAEKTAAYEIYIPQSMRWPYSSPNRTVLSVESGFIPIDYGIFSDHDVNKVAICAKKTEHLRSIVAFPIDVAYKNLNDRVTAYNQGQHKKVALVKDAFLQI